MSKKGFPFAEGWQVCAALLFLTPTSLASDQVTTLSDTTPPTPVKIVGITSDYGLLRSTPALGSSVNSQSTGSWSSSKERGQWIDLQPDGNRSVGAIVCLSLTVAHNPSSSLSFLTSPR